MERTITITLSLETTTRLLALAGPDQSLEDIIETILDESADLGTPASLHAAAHLATQAADLLTERWAQRRATIQRMADALHDLARER